MLALELEGNLLFLLCFTLYLGEFPSTSSGWGGGGGGGYILMGDLKEGFFSY